MTEETKEKGQIGIILLVIGIICYFFGLQFEDSVKEGTLGFGLYNLIVGLGVAVGLVGGIQLLLSFTYNASKEKIQEIKVKESLREVETQALLSRRYQTYDELMNFYIMNYVSKYGKDKLDSLSYKIRDSEKVNELIMVTMLNSTYPSAKEFVFVICDIPYFVSQSNETVKMASLIVLHKWNKEVNQHWHFVDQNGLLKMAIQIVSEIP